MSIRSLNRWLPAAKGAAMPALTAGEAVTPVTMNTEARVPQRADTGETRKPRKLHDAADLAALNALPGAGGTDIRMEMNFQVQGLDAATFKQKMKDCQKDFEALVRRVVDDMQHQKTRTAYAQ